MCQRQRLKCHGRDQIGNERAFLGIGQWHVKLRIEKTKYSKIIICNKFKCHGKRESGKIEEQFKKLAEWEIIINSGQWKTINLDKITQQYQVTLHFVGESQPNGDDGHDEQKNVANAIGSVQHQLENGGRVNDQFARTTAPTEKLLIFYRKNSCKFADQI